MSDTEEKVIGIVDRIRYHNRENGYHILIVEVGRNELVTVTAFHPTIHEGITYEFKGGWIVHPTYGKQMKAQSVFEVPPNTKEGLRAYLSSSFFPGIGPVIAGRIIKHFKDDVIRIFNEDIDKLELVPGISRRKLEMIKRSWADNDEINSVMMFLQQYGISTVYAAKIYKHYGKGCVAKIKEKPYDLAKDIKGIGFKYADKIALEIGIKPNSEERIRACIAHILETGSMDGHCYLLEDQIRRDSTDLLKVDIRDKVSNILKYMIQDNDIRTIYLENEEEDTRYYSKKLFFNEKRCANRIGELLLCDIDAYADEEELLKNYKGVSLSEEQKAGVFGIINKGVSVLTGGPGTGKCLAKGTEVLMFDGSKKKVELIKIGDSIMGDDSTARKILKLAHGYEKMYEIISNDNKRWSCNESHILSLRYNDTRNTIINGIKYSKGDIIDISIKDYLNLSDRKKHHLKQYSTKIDYSKNNLKLDPYMLGLWLGDGHTNSIAFRITNCDQEVFDFCQNFCLKEGYNYKAPEIKNSIARTINITGGDRSLYSVLKEIGVFNNKHIPKKYSINSEKNRLLLLAGLLDSDGHLDKRTSGNFSITQKNKKLAQDIYDLSMSLGFRTTINSKIATLKREGKEDYSCKVYRVIMGGDISKIPTKIKRKIANNKPNKNPLNSGFKITDKGIGEYYGFEINKNKRFVLGNYVVTHNSTMTKAVVEVLRKLGKSIALAAPTGRASQVMTEMIGRQASTVHRLLGWDHENFGFLHNESNPLGCDFLIIDESSMLDINLASSILRAVPEDCQVLFIGDMDQLPPVGPGAFFKDLIESGVVPSYRLTQIFRQGKESFIVDYAHKINNGDKPTINSPLTDPSIWKSDCDCMFIDSGLPEANKNNKEYPAWSSLRYGKDVIGMIKTLYMDTIPKYHKDKDIQILIPMKIGSLGCIRVNEIIQESANPFAELKSQIKLRDRIFREGDKVIHTVNNYELEVFNGDIGWVESVDEIGGSCEIKYGERIVNYKKVDMMELELAYAITIHKSQGSEFDCIIIPIMTQFSRMLYRNLLYTGLTRARKLAVFVGQRKAFNRSIDNIDPRTRQTSLKELLIETGIVNSFIA